MKFIFEFTPKRGIWVLIPTAVWFMRGADVDDATDITLAWLCFGATVRIK